MRVDGERLRRAVAALCPEVMERAQPYATKVLSEPELWYEVVSCILASQVPFELAKAASDRIREMRVFSWTDDPDLEALERKLMSLLIEPLMVGACQRRYRFPHLRARQLAAAFAALRESGSPMREWIFFNDDPQHIRSRLVAAIPGLGPKQASMFIRNVGCSYDLAILDSHVLSFMHLIGLLGQEQQPPTTLRRYETIEKVLSTFCRELGYAVGHVDRAIWVVMRVARREALI